MRPTYGLCSAAGKFPELLSNGNSCFKTYFTAKVLQVEGFKLGSVMDVFTLSLALETVISVSIT